MSNKNIIAVIDIGTGIGAKIGIFDIQGSCLQKGILPAGSYGRSAEVMVDRLVKQCKKLVHTADCSDDDIVAFGVDLPGVIFNGHVYICSNLPFLTGVNIQSIFEKKVRVPVIIINDGDSGGLMEWQIRKNELLYWVIGGGWGGAWIDSKGRVTGKGSFCDENSRGFFLVNEPGYATGIPADLLEGILDDYDLCLERFCHYFLKIGKVIPWQLIDPVTGFSYIRAESLISNIGLCCLFYTIFEKMKKSDPDNLMDQKLLTPDTAGIEIYRLCLSGKDEALEAMRLFGRIFGEVAILVTARAKAYGASDNIPIYLSGGLANSFRIFGSEMQKSFKKNDDHSVIEPSYFLDKEMNTNIMGTFFLARDTVFNNI